MGKVFDEIDDKLANWIGRQRVFETRIQAEPALAGQRRGLGWGCAPCRGGDS